MRTLVVSACVVSVALMSCADDDALDDAPTTEVAATSTAGEVDVEQRYPDVISAEAVPVGDSWTFSATISSPYDTAQRYADAWRVVAPDGTVLGVRELAHDHAAEQPFTRSLAGIPVPAEVDRVTIEARDQVYGWGGSTVVIELEAP